MSPKVLRVLIVGQLVLGLYWTVKSLVRIAADQYPYDGFLVLDLAVGLGYLALVVAMVQHYRRRDWATERAQGGSPETAAHPD